VVARSERSDQTLYDPHERNEEKTILSYSSEASTLVLFLFTLEARRGQQRPMTSRTSILLHHTGNQSANRIFGNRKIHTSVKIIFSGSGGEHHFRGPVSKRETPSTVGVTTVFRSTLTPRMRMIRTRTGTVNLKSLDVNGDVFLKRTNDGIDQDVVIDLGRVLQRTEKIDDGCVNLLVNEVLLILKVEKLKSQKDLVDVEHHTVQCLFHTGDLDNVLRIGETIGTLE